MLARLLSGGLAAAALLLITLLAGCGAPAPRPSFDDPGEWVGGTEQDAQRIVDRWLADASTGSGDLGWELLYPTTRSDLIGSEDVYRSAIGERDWSAFEYAITDVRTEDGEYRVELSVRDAPAVVEKWGLIQFHVVDGVGPERSADSSRIAVGDGFVTVRIGDEAEGAGIQGG